MIVDGNDVVRDRLDALKRGQAARKMDEWFRVQEERLEMEERLSEGLLRQLDAGIVAALPFLGSQPILAGGAGPILVGAGFPLPTFVELPLPWWCRPGARE